MTTAANIPRLPPPPPLQPRPRVNSLAIAVTLIFAAILIGLAGFSQPLAAGLYVPFFIILCCFQPEIALWMMFAEVAFPYDISGGGLVHTAPAEISLCMAFPIFFLRALASRRPHGGNPIFAPIMVYFVICILSTLMKGAGRDAIVAFFQMVIYLVIAVKFFSYCVPTNRQVYAALWGLIAACTFFSLYLCLTRSNAVLGIHKNATGTFLSYSVIMLAEMWLSATSGRRGKRWITLILVINIAGLIMSTSRGAWLGAVAGLGVLMICRRQYGLFARSALLLIPVILACWMFVPAEQQRYAFELQAGAHNVDTRFATIDTLMKQFKTSPIFGVGIGLRKEVDDTNIVFSTLAETGVIGLIAFLAIHGVFFQMVTFSWKVCQAWLRL